MEDNKDKEKQELNVKVKNYSDGSGSKIDIYDKDPYGNKDHNSIHIKVDYENKSYKTIEKFDDKKEESSGECYLTTACMQHFNKDFDDNCYELTVLRWFRDNFVSKEDVKHYYKTAPIIVEAINNSSDSSLIYDYIYENVISYCIDEIETGNFDKAYKRYKSSVLSFEETLARPYLEQKFVKSIESRIRR